MTRTAPATVFFMTPPIVRPSCPMVPTRLQPCIGAQESSNPSLAHELAGFTMHYGTESAGCRGRPEIETETVAYSLIWTGVGASWSLHGMVGAPGCEWTAGQGRAIL